MKESLNRIINIFISIIFTILIIGLVAFASIFVIDYFGIKDIPEEYSIVKLMSKYDVQFVQGISQSELKDEIKIQPNKREIAKTSNEQEYEYDPDILSRLSSGSDYGHKENNRPRAESNVFYYNQLNDYAKYIYDEIYNNYENLKTGTYVIQFNDYFNDLLHQENGETILNDSFQLAVNSLTYDKPELYFINITKMFLYTEKVSFAGIVRYKNSIGPARDGNYYSNEFSDEENTIDAINKVEEKISGIIDEANKQESDVKKISVIHDFIIENCEYTASSTNNNVYNAFGVLHDGKAVCEGYSKALKLLLDRINIESIIACGTGTNSTGQVESHAWNYVFLDGVWYGIDSTWDDPIILGIGTASYANTHKYFLVGSDILFKDHVENGELISSLSEEFKFKYPKLSINEYRER
jgi:hypothetical protein